MEVIVKSEAGSRRFVSKPGWADRILVPLLVIVHFVGVSSARRHIDRMHEIQWERLDAQSQRINLEVRARFTLVGRMKALENRLDILRDEMRSLARVDPGRTVEYCPTGTIQPGVSSLPARDAIGTISGFALVGLIVGAMLAWWTGLVADHNRSGCSGHDDEDIMGPGR